MSDQEKREQEIMNQEMSKDEMDTVAGGGGTCWVNSRGETCEDWAAYKYGRKFYNPDGSINCAATVEDGSWCGSNDACRFSEVDYLGMKECDKAWK
jgi:hypothetical protein